MYISKWLEKDNPKGLAVSLWNGSLETCGDCFVGCWNSYSSKQAKPVSTGDPRNMTLKMGKTWGKAIYICKNSVRSKQSFSEGLSKQEGAKQKPPVDILSSLWTT